VGIVLAKKVGDYVQSGELCATVYARDEAAAATVAMRVRAAFALGEYPVERLPILYERIDATSS